MFETAVFTVKLDQKIQSCNGRLCTLSQSAGVLYG